MELSVKQSLNIKQKIFYSRLLLGSFLSCGILIQLSLPSEAAFRSKVKGQRLEVKGQNLEIKSSPPSPPSLISQQTSVDKLSDVKPTDWAYQALKSLIEKYDVKLGLPDGTFRGNRALTRYEFAAGLAATLDKVNELITSSSNIRKIQQDRITLQRLEKEYRQALQDLRTRLNDIDSRSSELQANQFSSTTKLKGQQIVGLTDGRNANFTVVSRTRLTFETSFSQKDLLVTQLESGNNGGDAVGLAQKEDANLLGSDGIFANAGGLDFTDVEDDVKLRRLHYTLRPSTDLAVTVGTKMSPRDFIDGNRYANDEASDFSSGIFLNNPLIVQNRIDRNGGAGAAVVWKPNSKLAFRSLYIAGDADSTSEDDGFFGDPHQASAELEYTFSDKLTLKLQYTNAEIDDTDINAYGVNAEYVLNRNTGIFGRLGIGEYQGFNTAINQDLDLNPVSWTLGVGLRNIGIPGTIAGVAIGQPFVTDGVGNATQTNFETFYNLQVSDNISFTPAISLVINPDNDSNQDTIWQTTLRSTFSF
ncbi:MAG: iron uptake porin [Cyanobacteria bacterium J06643_5]